MDIEYVVFPWMERRGVDKLPRENSTAAAAYSPVTSLRALDLGVTLER